MKDEQLHQTSVLIADLQESLDVFEQLFIGVKVAEELLGSFPEVGELISKALLTKLIIGTAAVFTDPSDTFCDENMSLKNLAETFMASESRAARDLREQIEEQLKKSNIKKYRNKFVGHYGLKEMLGQKEVERNITINNLRNIYVTAQQYLNQLGLDSGLLNKGSKMSYYEPIPDSRSPRKLSELVKKYA